MSKQYIIKNGKAVEVSEEIYEYLIRSDRHIRYVEKDLKRNKYIVDNENEKTLVIPKREQSLDRLTELGKDFADSTSDFQDNTIRKIMLEQALAKLSDEERYLITQLFYFGRTERELAVELHQTQQNINKIKHRILCKLYDILKI